MRNEPAFDRTALLEAVRAQYAVDVDAIAFVPVGYATACYRLEAGGEPSYFLKVWPDTVAGRDGARKQHVVLPLLQRLETLELSIRVPSPITSAQGLLATFSGMSCALFSWLPGVTPAGWPDWPQVRWEAIAGALAEITEPQPHSGRCRYRARHSTSRLSVRSDSRSGTLPAPAPPTIVGLRRCASS